MNILDKFKLDGKVAFITGGAKGIGKSIAMGYAQAGADLAIVDIDMEAAEATAIEITEEYGVKTLAIKTDVTKAEEVEKMVAEVNDHFGRIDIAVANAGIALNVAADEMSLAEWQRVIDINLTGVFLTAQAAGKVMIAQGGGSIINTASMSGHIVNTPQPQCAYNASKAAVSQLTKSMAVEWAEKNVRVNSVSPGYIGTELITEAPALKPLIEQWTSVTPQKRMGDPDELQGIYLYLASDASTYTTGSDIIVDGGYTSI